MEKDELVAWMTRLEAIVEEHNKLSFLTTNQKGFERYKTIVAKDAETLAQLRALISRDDDVERLVGAARDVAGSGISFEYPRYYEIQVDKSAWKDLAEALKPFEEATDEA